MKKHLVIDIRMYEMSGIGRYIKEILSRLIKLNLFNITLLCYKKDIPAIRAVTSLNIKLIVINSKIFSISEQFEIPFKCPPCDVYWSPQYNYPILVKLKCHHVLTTIHDCYQWANTKYLKPLHFVYINIFSTLLRLPFVNVITVSNFSKSEIIKYINIEDCKINVIYNGAGITNCSDSSIPYSSKKGILAVGNIKPHKNISCLIMAFAALNLDLQEDNPLYIIGKNNGFVSPDFSLDSDILNNSRFINYLGEVSDEDLSRYYKSSKYFVFPSLYEGFGLPGLEAISNGCSLICSDIPIFREIYGNNATYFDPYSFVDLQKILSNLSILHPITENINYSIFNWDISVQKHAEVIQNLQ